MPDKKILIIEDEKPMAHALELKLKNNGFNVTVAFNGEDGLNFLEKEPFDFILLDLIMPKIDGFKVLEKLQAKKNSIPVIVLSNLSQDEDKKRAETLGARGYFIKSNITLKSIIENIKQILGI